MIKNIHACMRERKTESRVGLELKRWVQSFVPVQSSSNGVSWHWRFNFFNLRIFIRNLWSDSAQFESYVMSTIFFLIFTMKKLVIIKIPIYPTLWGTFTHSFFWCVFTLYKLIKLPGNAANSDSVAQCVFRRQAMAMWQQKRVANLPCENVRVNEA